MDSLKKDLTDAKTETLALGMIYQDPALLDKYGDKINPSLDFSMDSSQFYYRLMYDCYFTQGKLNETAIKVFLDSDNGERKRAFRAMGGFETMDDAAKLASESLSDFSLLYTKLKTFYAMRQLKEHHVDVTPYKDAFENKSPEFILENYERMLNQIALNLKGIESPENLGVGATNLVEQLQEHPDIGIDLPHELLNRYLRGLRLRTVNCIAAHTNRGKTRIVTDILMHASVFNDHKCLLISTEMTKDEMKLQFLTSTYNHLFKEDEPLQETTIATNNTTEQQKQRLVAAAQYFEEHCKVDFICVNIYDYETLKRYIKQAEMSGVEMIVIDVLKPMRSANQVQALQEWQQYPRTVEQLKDLMIELDMTLLFTAQLTTQSVNDKDLDINNIANGTQISHVLDSLLIWRDVQYKELEVSSYIPIGSKGDDTLPFDLHKRYMVCKIAKNRSGLAGTELVYEANRGAVTFDELGRFVRSQSVV